MALSERAASGLAAEAACKASWPANPTQVFLVFVAACLGLAGVLFGAVVVLWS